VAAGIHCHDATHLQCESASHPIEPRCTLLAVLQIRAMPQGIAVVVRPAWARSSGCNSPAELTTARQVKRNCARVTERGEEAWGESVEREP